MTDTTEVNHAKILKDAVLALSPAQMPEPNVELVIPLVSQGIEAYQHIRTRTALIREELNKAQALVRS